MGSGTVIMGSTGVALKINTKRVGHMNSTGVTLRRTNRGTGKTMLTSSTFFPVGSAIRATTGTNVATVVRPKNSVHSRSSVGGTSRCKVTVIFANMHRFGRWSGDKDTSVENLTVVTSVFARINMVGMLIVKENNQRRTVY